jgi:hypothetical protein
MIKDKSLGWSLLLALAAVALLSTGVNAAETKQSPKSSKASKSMSKETPPPVQMVLEPKAMDIIKATSSRLASARTMSFTAVVSYESPSRLGTPLVYTTKSEVTLQRPDKLRVITPGDGPASEFYYDGKTMTAFAPDENLVAVAPAPPTIDAALKAAYDSAAIYFPFANIMAEDPYKGISDGLVVAFNIGQSQIVGGTTTDIVAYANKNVFIQAWVGVEDKLPRRVRAIYHSDMAQRRYEVDFYNWQLDLPVPEDVFLAKNAAGANPIAFAHPHANPLPHPEPPAKSKSSKPKAKPSEEVQHIMKKIFVSLLITALLCGTAVAASRGNRAGGSTSHSEGLSP